MRGKFIIVDSRNRIQTLGSLVKLKKKTHLVDLILQIQVECRDICSHISYIISILISNIQLSYVF